MRTDVLLLSLVTRKLQGIGRYKAVLSVQHVDTASQPQGQNGARNACDAERPPNRYRRNLFDYGRTAAAPLYKKRAPAQLPNCIYRFFLLQHTTVQMQRNSGRRLGRAALRATPIYRGMTNLFLLPALAACDPALLAAAVFVGLLDACVAACQIAILS